MPMVISVKRSSLAGPRIAVLVRRAEDVAELLQQFLVSGAGLAEPRRCARMSAEDSCPRKVACLAACTRVWWVSYLG
jgi:hypothetical protein